MIPFTGLEYRYQPDESEAALFWVVQTDHMCKHISNIFLVHVFCQNVAIY